jgi:putative membrane protein
MNRNVMMNARMCTRLLAFAGVAVLAGASAVAQGNMNGQQPNSGNMNGGANSTMSPGSPMAGQNGSMGSMPMDGNNAGSMQDKTFAKKALAGGMAEVQLGQLATQKSNSDDVKKFGQQMVDDHTKLGDQLKPIAASIGVQPPMGLMPKDKELMIKLQGLSGDDFDKAYIKAMLKDHKQDDKEFQMEASSGQNADEKAAAMQGDQIIKQHLQMVEELAKAHGVMGGSKSSM